MLPLPGIPAQRLAVARSSLADAMPCEATSKESSIESVTGAFSSNALNFSNEAAHVRATTVISPPFKSMVSRSWPEHSHEDRIRQLWAAQRSFRSRIHEMRKVIDDFDKASRLPGLAVFDTSLARHLMRYPGPLSLLTYTIREIMRENEKAGYRAYLAKRRMRDFIRLFEIDVPDDWKSSKSPMKVEGAPNDRPPDEYVPPYSRHSYCSIGSWLYSYHKSTNLGPSICMTRFPTKGYFAGNTSSWDVDSSTVHVRSLRLSSTDQKMFEAVTVLWHLNCFWSVKPKFPYASFNYKLLRKRAWKIFGLGTYCFDFASGMQLVGL